MKDVVGRVNHLLELSLSSLLYSLLSLLTLLAQPVSRCLPPQALVLAAAAVTMHAGAGSAALLDAVDLERLLCLGLLHRGLGLLRELHLHLMVLNCLCFSPIYLTYGKSL